MWWKEKKKECGREVARKKRKEKRWKEIHRAKGKERRGWTAQGFLSFHSVEWKGWGSSHLLFSQTTHPSAVSKGVYVSLKCDRMAGTVGLIWCLCPGNLEWGDSEIPTGLWWGLCPIRVKPNPPSGGSINEEEKALINTPGSTTGWNKQQKQRAGNTLFRVTLLAPQSIWERRSPTAYRLKMICYQRWCLGKCRPVCTHFPIVWPLSSWLIDAQATKQTKKSYLKSCKSFV